MSDHIVEKIKALDAEFVELEKLPHHVIYSEFASPQQLFLDKKISYREGVYQLLDWYPPIREARELLKHLPPFNMLKLVEGKSCSSLALFTFIKGHLAGKGTKSIFRWSDRKRFVYWVYRNKLLSSVLPYVRPASESKHFVLRYLLRPLKKQESYYSSKVVHAWAFRPDFFKAKAGYEPLYTTRKIAKSQRGYRTLDIPFIGLAKLQRAILKKLLNPACQSVLTDSVFGFTPGNDRTTFWAAEAHVGGKFLVGFDIADFFHTVRFDDVTSVLMKLPSDILGTFKSPLSKDKSPLKWEWDLVLLLAKLMTYKGRLPQGAPTSPALANLVFHEYDVLIRQQFLDSFEYTRYADDLTFSISATKAKKLGIKSALDAQQYLEKRLVQLLERSSFKLNSKKSRAVNLRQGGRVLGLYVYNDGVGVPRSTRRALRTTLHKMRNHGLLYTARNHPALPDCSEFVHQDTKRGVRHFFKSGRVSMERLCSLTAHRICRNLTISDLRNQGSTRELIGNRLRDTLERVISNAWLGKLVLEKQDSKSLLVSFNSGDPALLLRAETGIDFLLLGRKDSVKCALLHQSLSGYLSFLEGAPNRATFSAIRDLAKQLGDVLGSLDIGKFQPAASRQAGRTDGERPSLTIDEDVTRKARAFLAKLGISDFEHAEWEVLCRAVYSRVQLDSWLTATDKLIKEKRVFAEGSRRNPVRFIDIRAGKIFGRRTGTYDEENQYLVRRLSEDGLSRPDLALQLQEELIEDLIEYAEQAGEQGDTAYPEQSVRLERVCAELKKLRNQLTTTNESMLLFARRCSPENDTNIRKRLEKLEQPISGDSSWAVWNGLFEFGFCFVQSFQESLEHDDEGKPVATSRAWKDIKRYNVLSLLRNRHAHCWERTAANLANLDEIQKTIAKRLGKIWNPKKDQDGDTLESLITLELTAFEANEFTLDILNQLRDSLIAVRQALQTPPSP